MVAANPKFTFMELQNSNNPKELFLAPRPVKTELSADRSRQLIGDDEHGWNDDGVFNFEGGCYAKTIKLSAEAEPDIWHATHSYATVLENVIVDPVSRKLDLDDSSLTENTRAAYPLSILNNTAKDARGGTPHNVFLLTCDAYGVTPPIALLSEEQARACFLLGFASKVAGTERGVDGPTPTFSTCFGAPFLTRKPEVYADMFASRLKKSGARAWLINTGWTGGGADTGHRMPIAATRALLQAAMDGTLSDGPFVNGGVWTTRIPANGPGEAARFLHPENTSADK